MENTNNDRNTLKELRASIRLKMMSNFKEIRHVEIPEIPSERTLCPNSETDYWYKIETPLLDASVCIYELGVGQTFPPHFHDINSEHIVILTKGGELEVVTNKYEEIFKFPSSIFFEPKEPHAVINKSNEPLILMIIWTPKMLGFNASFIDND